jgi:hypothetical protein
MSSQNPREKQGTTVITKGDLDNVLSLQEWAELDEVVKIGFTKYDQRDMKRMGKKQQLGIRWAIYHHPHQSHRR